MATVKKRDKSPSSTPIPTTEAPQTEGSQLPEAEWDAMHKVLSAIYDYRTEDGFDPSKLFQRMVNKRVLPEYYETIKEPMALSTIKKKLQQKAYTAFADYVRDFALIPHNAQVFNRPDSGAFQDALIIKEQLEKQLQLLVNDGLITQEDATLPDLGEIPTYDDVPMEDADGGDGEDESSDDEGEEDEDEEGEEDEEGRRRKRRARGSTSNAKREAAGDDDGGRKSRARPPKLQTPMEARIQAILKGLRKPKNQRGQVMIKNFDTLPNKLALPDYYIEIKNPIAYDMLKRKFKRKKYSSLEHFMSDVNLMFENAKQYNEDESQIYKDAVVLQVQAGKLYDSERAKPDGIFVDDEGKIPMPAGVLHNGELYKVGDWVHVQNPNDLTKPIPAQVYRTYKNQQGQLMVNVCWYYRPEQTVHRFDKHFLPNEVVKTGRYKDHRAEEVQGRCFIMFTTRYFKGRPRGLSEGTEVYVCEARYNERDHSFNRIKTWASCLPDEVRDKDYEMDLFDRPRQMRKFPSPIAYLLKDDQKETDDLPKVQWGAEGAPPRIGAVHRRRRGEKDSPPPEANHSAPPKVESPAVLQRTTSGQAPPSGIGAQPLAATPVQQLQRPAPTLPRPPSFGASHPQQYVQPTGPTTASRPTLQHNSSYGIAAAPQTPAQAPQQLVQPRPASGPGQSTGYHPPTQPTTSIPPNPSTFARPSTASYRDPPPIEVYVLPEQANLSIPAEVREQYQQDEAGRVLFFTAPPVISEGQDGNKGHSVRYLAEKARRAEALQKKRSERELQQSAEQRVAKKARIEEQNKVEHDLEALKRRALGVLEDQLRVAVAGELGEKDLGILADVQVATANMNSAVEAQQQRRDRENSVRWAGEPFEDDWDNRVIS